MKSKSWICLLGLFLVNYLFLLFLPMPTTAALQPHLKSNHEIKNPTWSPDGEAIIYAEKHSPKTTLKQYNLESGVVRELVTAGTHNSQPACSPAGQSYYFLHRSEQGPGEIWTYNSARETTAPFIDKELFSGWVESPAPHPSGFPFAFFGRKGGKFGIWLLDEDNSVSKLTAAGNFQFSPTWGRRGLYLYYLEKGAEIKLNRYSLKSGKVKTLYTSKFMLAPDVNPVTGELVFVTKRDGARQVVALSPEGELRVLTTGLEKNSDPAVSPSGTKLVFVSNKFKPGELWFMDLPRPNGRVPHTIRVNTPQPTEKITAGSVVDGAATGTISVDEETTLRRAEQVIISLRTPASTRTLARHEQGVVGELARIPETVGSTARALVVEVRDQKGKTVREIPINSEGVVQNVQSK